MDMITANDRSALLWSAILAVSAIVGSYGLACVFPFAAIAALGALTLPLPRAAALVASVWLANQIVGFTLLSYPHDLQAVEWGLVIGLASFLALGAAKATSGLNTPLLSVRVLFVLIASIASYQTVMFAGAYALGGFESSTLEIVTAAARNDVIWFATLGALRLVLGHGLPRMFGPTLPLRSA